MSHEKSENLNEQWYTIKFYVKLKKIFAETKEMLYAAYNETVMSQASIYRWYNKLKSDRKSVE